ncbi:transmembrane protein 81 [Callorhinchus milii]|uniref:transmembrane protein 81 n=1 Tax=Callorhinchus milii TaxID=7868 RepID=UPI0004573ED9|nr:transmembrane protein 81 [Callorhinchus milii]|eukprot:gi/632963282/ref/XP_007897793.1/ PREDICTED: transmembrane protein 81 [Callorhinchus milii]
MLLSYAGALILSALLPARSHQDGQWVTAPPELQNVTVTGVLLMSASPCSKTCGLGWRSEYRCRVDKVGNTTECILEKALCLVSKECGLTTRTLTAGTGLNLSCVDETMESVGLTEFTFIWRIAKGVVTTDNFFFRPYPLRYTKAPWLISFTQGLLLLLLLPLFSPVKPVQERNAGTYMCEVQNSQTMEVVKQILNAIRVLPAGLVELDFFKALSAQQKLEMMEGEQVPAIQKGKIKRWWEFFNSFFTNTNSNLRFVGIGGTIGTIVGLLILYTLKRR